MASNVGKDKHLYGTHNPKEVAAEGDCKAEKFYSECVARQTTKPPS